MLNVAGYFDGLMRFLTHAIGEGFVRREYLSLLVFEDAPAALLDALAAWRPPALPRAWLDQSQT
jgi:predicted Rossmann-fold nucleotide-binding protein